MKKISIYAVMAAAVLLITSCYKLFNITAPAEVEAGTTFEVRMAVKDDGSDVQNFTTDWSMAGIRAPEGWEVSVPTGAHEQYAESWVYYQDGSQVASRQDMEADDYLAELYEEAAPKKGYKWVAFVSKKMVAKHMTACWRNGCDSIVITFQVTVPVDTKPGNYKLDFLGGDEEDSRGVYKYPDYASTDGSRLFHVGTVATLAGGRKVDNANTGLSKTIRVTEPSAVSTVKADDADENIYDLSGRLIRRGADTDGLPSGTYVVGGKKVVK